MIKRIVIGDILEKTDPPHDIIIGMNTELGDLTALGHEVLKDNLPRTELLDLGTVLTFQYTKERQLHMIICHHLGQDGWRGANQYVRVGLDHLWVTRGERNYGIVQIGTGRVGARDGANGPSIFEAIASSYLYVDMFIRGDENPVPSQSSLHLPPIPFVSGWNQTKGELVPG